MNLASVESLIPIHPKRNQYALIQFEKRFESLIPIHAKEKQHALVYFKGRLMT